MSKRKSNSIPEGVKRPLNPFQCFIKMQAQAYRRDGTGEKKTSKEFGLSWRLEMSDEDKKPYYQMADEDRKRYERELTATGCKVKRRRAEGEHPSRPCPPFLFYTSKHFKGVMEEQNVSYHGALRILGEKWRQMDAEARKPYVEMAQADREKWLDDFRIRTEEIVEQVTPT
jgi:hypothetical protein